MKTFNSILFSAVLVATYSCSNNSGETDSQEKASPEKEKICSYQYNAPTTVISFTAFKTSDKVAVGGKFDDVEITGTKEQEKLADVFKEAAFQINTASVNTNNKDRDKKIVDHFFGALKNNTSISGKVIRMEEEDATSGTALVAFTINDSIQEVSTNYVIEDKTITLNGTIDATSFGAGVGIKALNKVCEDLHKGTDGISKLWSEVGIQVTTSLTMDCR